MSVQRLAMVLVLLALALGAGGCSGSSKESADGSSGDVLVEPDAEPTETDAAPADGVAPDSAPVDVAGLDGEPADLVAPDAAPSDASGLDASPDTTAPLDVVSGADALQAPNSTSPLGTGLNGVTDWSTEISFVDAFKASRAWISGSSSQWDDGRTLDLDADGWVRSLQSDQIARTIIFTDMDGHYPTGRYLVLYEGKGTLTYFGAPKRNDALSTPGRDVVDVSSADSLFAIYITATDPGDYLRNIRVIMPGGVCQDDPFKWCASDSDCAASCTPFESNYQTQIFHPTFLARIRSYRVLRFMDWMETNNSTQSQWAGRPKPSDARWTRAGVPLEVMVELANRLNADPWFNIPHLANDEYVTQFATLLAASLKPSLKAYIEHSNEVWNGIFSQAGYARTRGLELGLSTNDFEAQLFYHSRRSAQIFALFAAVYGDQLASRVVRVMASQAANSWVSEQVLGFENAYEKSDALAIAPYFGGSLGGPANQTKVQAMTLDALFAELTNVELPESLSWVEASAKVAKTYGVRLIAYEGGQHLAGNGGVENNDTINALFDAANRDARMKTLYLAYLAGWKEKGGELFVHFVNCGAQSKWGRWGALEYVDQPREQSPKFDALQTFIETTPAWW